MKKNLANIFVAFLIALTASCESVENKNNNHSRQYWTLTYIKANPQLKAELKSFLVKNWFAMDSIAVVNGLINSYELYENQDNENPDWDYIVAVEYYSKNGYDEIVEEFEEIRKSHKTVKINNMDFKDLGKFVKTESVLKH